MFGWLKNKAVNPKELDDCLDYLSYEIDDASKQSMANKVGSYIWVGLMRNRTEGVSLNFFRDLYRTAKNEAIGKYRLIDVRHSEFVAPYVAMSYFNARLIKAPESDEVMRKIRSYIDKYASLEVRQQIMYEVYGDLKNVSFNMSHLRK